ncbi:telomere length and silencing protein 1 homolog [Galendromus occidentalis]|uniref:Telomere length and silencing protein 1 homolog n=1 Tax=Galendromus occidentalis TaxID=34638 RepID=A0AAJ6QMA6_9ACAR|nr:telomere length and silencing protein 1 homolog [Galendromus occidentalis]
MASDDTASSSKAGVADTVDEVPQIVFKKSKRKKCLRTTPLIDDEDDHVDRSVLEDTKELQKLRKRPHGVSVEALILGKPVADTEEKVSDPFKIDSGGGLTDMKASSTETIVIGNQFASETNERDEDADMMKYIEAELKKRQGTQQQTEAEAKPLSLKSEDLLMQILPNHLERSQGQKNEEMLSNQMLAGIPEVDLGMEERIRNIEATEEAKMKMLHERMSGKRKETSLVPTNISVNFESQQKKPKKEQVRREREPGGPMRASDDAHLEKFRKHFNRR